MTDPVLPYADLVFPTHQPSVYDVHPDVRRIRVAPVPEWRLLGRALLGGTTLAVVAVTLLAFRMALRPREAVEWLGSLIEASVALGLLVAVAIDRLHRRLAFEVTPFAFSQIVTSPFGASRTAWPRSALRGASVHRFNGRLRLRLDGRTPLEIFVGADPNRVANDLEAACDAIAAAPAGLQPAGVTSENALGRKHSRIGLTRTALGLVIVALAVTPFSVPIGLGLVIFAAVPVGLALGDQGKEYWN